jgi:hypothetical protein
MEFRRQGCRSTVDVSGWEQAIYEWVYRFYGLTPEEIKIVEGKS